MPTVQHFEIPADDVTRVQKFYKDVFGWEMKKEISGKNPDEDYYMFKTQDEKGNEGITGGMMKRQSPHHTVTNYITISSIDEYTTKIEHSGGKAIMPKMPVTDMGYIRIYIDSENNMFGLFEEKK
jgi:uncharacterized protein